MSRLRALSAALALSFAATHAVAADLVIAGRDDIYGRGWPTPSPASTSCIRAPRSSCSLPNANLYQKLLSMREGTGAYDLVMMDDTWAPEFIGNGWLKPLPASLTPISCRPPSRSAATRPARCTRCRSSATSMFAYRKDLLAK